MTFTVFTMDGRSSELDGDAAVFIVKWKNAVDDPACEWPFAYLTAEEGNDSVVHFNPLAITAVAVEVKPG